MLRRALCNAKTAAAGLGVLSVLLSGGAAVAHDAETATPIKHLIILIGENWTFDSIYATYQPKRGDRDGDAAPRDEDGSRHRREKRQSVLNLLSQGIVTVSGDPGPNHSRSYQFQVNTPYPAN